MFLALLFVCMLAWWGFQGDMVLPAQAVLPLAGKIIGVDPGHGGYDPGATHGEVMEKDIVLEISLYLRDYLQQGGARVVMTRDRDMDLLELPAGPKKRADLRNRLKLLQKEGVELIISIHANDSSSPRWRGAQTFYREDCAMGKRLSCAIQEELRRLLKNTHREAQSANYYILKEAFTTAVLVEVGFLSNPYEAGLLSQPDYQKKIAWAIYMGTVKYYWDRT